MQKRVGWRFSAYEREGLDCEVCVDGMRLDTCHNLNTRDVFWMNLVQMVPSGREDMGAITSLVNIKNLQLECALGLHEALLVQACSTVY